MSFAPPSPVPASCVAVTLQWPLEESGSEIAVTLEVLRDRAAGAAAP